VESITAWCSVQGSKEMTPNKSLDRTVVRRGAHRARVCNWCAGRCAMAVVAGRSTESLAVN
jgi:hypothetical protein